MTLNGRYPLSHSISQYGVFGAYHQNLNKERPTLSGAKMLSSHSSFWQNKVYADIREGSVERGVERQWGRPNRKVDNRVSCLYRVDI